MTEPVPLSRFPRFADLGIQGAAYFVIPGLIVTLAFVLLINERRRLSERAWLWGLLATMDFGAAATAYYAGRFGRPASAFSATMVSTPLFGAILAGLTFMTFAVAAQLRGDTGRKRLAFLIFALNFPIFAACLLASFGLLWLR
ncbi:MAG: hypothetical protein ACRD2H_11720 [Terriglobales bacterium]